MRALLASALFAVSEWLFNPKCPLGCGDRTANLEAHFYDQHAGDELP